jgi:Protein of unknown function (DUF2550)
MRIFEGVAVAVVALVVVLGLLFIRRTVIARGGGTIELSLRLSARVPGRGWSPGIGRFSNDELRWYRIFSFAFRARRRLSRRALAVDARRSPEGPERLVLPADWVVIRCMTREGAIEIAMAESTLTGFLSWVEAAPPGAASMRMAA